MPSKNVPGHASHRPSWAHARRRSNTTTRAKTHRQCTRTDTQTCRQRDGRPQRRCCARILLTVRGIGPTNGNHRLNHLEVRTRSARNGPYIQQSPRKNSWVKRYLTSVRSTREVEPSATPRGATTQQRSIILPQRQFVPIPQRGQNRWRKNCPRDALLQTVDETNKLPLKTTASWRVLSGQLSHLRFSAETSFRDLS